MGLFVVFAPSGTGKTSLSIALVEAEPQVVFSVSHTTRPMRTGEKNGVDYIFVDEKKFFTLQAADGFIEYAQVYGNWYGTSYEQLNKQLTKGNVLLEIDWQGAQQIKAAKPDAILIGILPPNINEVRQRLQKRGNDSVEIIEKRMQSIDEEIKQLQLADYLVINADFSQALADLRAIVRACDLQYQTMQNHHQQLLSESHPLHSS